MERKFKPKLGVIGLCGIIFGGTGLLMLIMFVVLIASDSGLPAVAVLFPLLFIGIGGAMIGVTVSKNKKQKQIMETGVQVMAEFAGTDINATVSVNGRNPYIAILKYRDEQGIEHVFRSGDIYQDPAPLLSGRQVPVYVLPYDFDSYYVDIDSVIQNNRMF